MTKEKIDLIMYMDVIKIFTKNEKNKKPLYKLLVNI